MNVVRSMFWANSYFQSLSLCTALLMFMLSRDRLNMDLDRQSLDLMLKLLAVDYQEEQSATVLGKRTLNRNKDRAREVYEQWKAEGGATNQPEIEDVSVRQHKLCRGFKDNIWAGFSVWKRQELVMYSQLTAFKIHNLQNNFLNLFWNNLFRWFILLS